jgi:hypothetical protein
MIPKRKFKEPNSKNQKAITKVQLGISFLVLSAGVGCVTLPSLKDEPAPKTPPKPAAVNQELFAPPVTPDEVTEGNVHEKVEALRKELSREDK